MVCFQGARGALGRRIDGVCGAGAFPLPDLPPEPSRSRSAPEKSVYTWARWRPVPGISVVTVEGCGVFVFQFDVREI